MSFFKPIIFIFFFVSFIAHAAVVDCEPIESQSDWISLHSNIELKPANVNITLGSNLPDWQKIYEMKNVVIGRFYANCNEWVSSQYTILSSEQPIWHSGAGSIYKTNVPGIGVSIDEVYDNRGSKGQPVTTFPNYTYGVDNPGKGTIFSVNITFWKIPNENIPLNTGVITVSGPEIASLIGAGSGATMTSSDNARILHGGAFDYYINSSRMIQGTLIFQPGTCNIEGEDIKVNMGNFYGGNYSEWKDGSFKLVCPNGFGYDGSVDAQNNTDNPYNISPNAEIAANSMHNGRVQISIIPYTEVVDANKGIIALDGTGARGYGIQLAWGDYSSQNSVEPANPVVLNSYVDANSLNSGFGAGDTPIGGNAFNGTDNTIKMAARYIRTTGETAPGPANAVVQVIANYQ